MTWPFKGVKQSVELIIQKVFLVPNNDNYTLYFPDQTAKTNALKEELDKLKADSSAEKSALVEEIAKMKAEMASIQQGKQIQQL